MGSGRCWHRAAAGGNAEVSRGKPRRISIQPQFQPSSCSQGCPFQPPWPGEEHQSLSPFAIRNREWDKTVRKLPPASALILKTWGKPSAPT